MKPFQYFLSLLLALVPLVAPTASHALDGCFPYVQQQAHEQAQQPFAKTPMMKVDTGRITYDHYQHIRFRPEKTFWRNEKLPFQLEFMHPGMHFIHPISLFSWEDGKAKPITFSSHYFDYTEVADLNLKQDEPHMGFTGFRILSAFGQPANRAPVSETVVFQGASYFRALGQEQRYGLSARGLAINTAHEGQEEFPDYTHFWLEKPAKEANELVFCALLNSPSLTGASRFVLTPGKATQLEVETHLYPRNTSTPPLEIGVAPLTSMFFHGENSLSAYGDYRPEVHDSDGLLIQQGKQWLWQPLEEVPYFNLQSLPVSDLAGFGLMQRDRDFDHYQDLEAHYHERPSVWVEPLDDWGKGEIRVLRLHTRSDIVDNVVAYWTAPIGQLPKTLHYRLSWRSTEPVAHKLGKVISTRATNRTVDGMPEQKGQVQLRLIVDFAGLPTLPTLPTLTEIPEVDYTLHGPATAKQMVIQPNPHTKGWRVIAHILPERCDQPLRLELKLTNGRNPLTETWSYPLSGDLCSAH